MGRIGARAWLKARSGVLALGGAVQFFTVPPALAREGKPLTSGQVPAGPAITRLAAQADLQILFPLDIVEHCMVSANTGRGDALQRLRRLLRPCQLRARPLSNGTILIERMPRRIAAPPLPEPPAHEGITVTALKRNTNLATTAISMSVSLGEDLGRRSNTGPRAAAASLPGLGASETGSGSQRLTVRGVYGVGEPTVAVYYDETPVAGPSGTTLDPASGAPDLELVDIDRAELLRGPQGTLYGASSMGGTLRILFNKPDLASTSAAMEVGVVAAQHGQLGETATGVLNLPLMRERLAIRAVGYRNVSPGYIYDDATHDRGGGRVSRVGARLSTAFAATPDLNISGLIAWQHLHGDNAAYWYGDDGRYRNDQGVVTPYNSRILLSNLTARLNLDAATVVATVSRYRWRKLRSSDYTSVLSGQRSSEDGCERYAGISQDCSAAQMAAYGEYVDSRLPGLLWQPMAVVASNAELRMVSAGRSALEWTLGFFAEHRHDTVDSYALRADALTGRVVRPFDITGYRHITQTLTQFAVFGEIDWHMVPGFTLTAGGRYFDYSRAGRGTVPISNVITGTSDLDTFTRHMREDGKNLKLELAWQPRASILAYAQASQGFRPGGINITPGLTSSEQHYHSDGLWSYEIGAKFHRSEWRDASLSFTLFHIDWSHMITNVTSASGAFQYNANAGSANIDGTEIEGSVLPWRGGTISLSATALEARLAQDEGLSSAAGQARRGDALPFVPHLSLSARAGHRMALGSGDTLRLEGILAYRTGFASQFNSHMSYYERTPSELTVDASLGWHHRSWSVDLIISNVFNAMAITRVTSDSSGARQIYGNGPRTIGLSIRKET